MERQIPSEAGWNLVTGAVTVRATTTIIIKALFSHFIFYSLKCFRPSGSDLSGMLPEVSGVAQVAAVLKPNNHSSLPFLSERIWALEGLEAVPD